MPVTRNFKQAFSGGEISPEMFGRIADNKFQQVAALLLKTLWVYKIRSNLFRWIIS